MKAILEFKLPEDQNEFDYANNGIKLAAIIYDLDQDLKSKITYNSEKESEDVINTYEYVRKTLRKLMVNYSVSIEDLL